MKTDNSTLLIVIHHHKTHYSLTLLEKKNLNRKKQFYSCGDVFLSLSFDVYEILDCFWIASVKIKPKNFLL
jgi:hypothetical protein